MESHPSCARVGHPISHPISWTALWRYDRGVTVDVLYFGVLKDFFGGEKDLVELADGAAVEDLLDLLRGRAGEDLPVWKAMAVAVNREYAGPETVLKGGDEVALLPPVSGGCHAR